MLQTNRACWQKQSTEAGLEPTRDKPNRFLVDRLNHSATRSVDSTGLLSYYDFLHDIIVRGHGSF